MATKTLSPPGIVSFDSPAALMELATIVYRGGPPAGFAKPEQVAIAIAYGAEVGLKPMQSVASIKVVGGKPSIYGEAGLALLRSSADLQSINMGIDSTDDNPESRFGWIETIRKSEKGTIRQTIYKIADAIQAGLWGGKHMGGKGPWVTNPERMLKWRAIGFHLRDWWPEVMCGLVLTEEVEDIIDTTATVVATHPTPTAAASAAVAANSGSAAVTPVGVLSDKVETHTLRSPEDGQVGPINDMQLKELATRRDRYLLCLGIDLDDKEAKSNAWREFLSKWKVETAKSLTTQQAEHVIAIMDELILKKEDSKPVF
jgi:hypothetical protein